MTIGVAIHGNEGPGGMIAILISFVFATILNIIDMMDMKWFLISENMQLVKDILYIISMLIVIILGAHKLYRKFFK